MIRQVFLATAEVVLDLVRDRAVGTRWAEPSALPGFTTGGLAAHLAGQVTRADSVLRGLPSPDSAIALLDHYQRSDWVHSDRDSEINVAIRESGERHAEAGQHGVVELTGAALERLRQRLPTEPSGRVVELPWAGWCLTLDDFLITRIMEMVVHSDDLAVSVDVDTPRMPGDALDATIRLLAAVAARRHGALAVIRTFSRVERAPGSVAAF
ncbi:MAG TPA: maleylpyruvate isomerase N-terminal domain-containing protein [Micromonosporaceae bacterium]